MCTKGSTIDATTAAMLSLVASFIQSSDFLLFAKVNLSNVGCKQEPNVFTLFSTFNCRVRTISRAIVGSF